MCLNDKLLSTTKFYLPITHERWKTSTVVGLFIHLLIFSLAISSLRESRRQHSYVVSKYPKILTLFSTLDDFADAKTTCAQSWLALKPPRSWQASEAFAVNVAGGNRLVNLYWNDLSRWWNTVGWILSLHSQMQINNQGLPI